MANIINTITELENIFQDITTQILGFDPDLPTNQDKVRIAWAPEGMPTFKITDDLVFLRVVEIDSPINRLRNITYNPPATLTGKQVTEYTRVIEAHWTFYGPNGFERADLIRHSIFLDTYKYMFNSNNLYLITDVQAPIRTPEEFMSQWWSRTDFIATFNEYVKREDDIEYLQTADITIVTDSDYEQTIDITE